MIILAPMLNSIPYTKRFVLFLFSSSSVPPLCGHVIAMHGFFMLENFKIGEYLLPTRMPLHF
jgi:hypothetical protein